MKRAMREIRLVVLTLDGNSKHVAHVIRFVTAVDLVKCLEQIKDQSWLLTCASISDLPSYRSTLDKNTLLSVMKYITL